MSTGRESSAGKCTVTATYKAGRPARTVNMYQFDVVSETVILVQRVRPACNLTPCLSRQHTTGHLGLHYSDETDHNIQPSFITLLH